MTHGEALGASGGDSAPIDTTGCTFLVVGGSWYYGTTLDADLQDSKSNTWTLLTAVSDGALVARARIWYVVNPTVGTGHTFNLSGLDTFIALMVAGFSGSHATPFDLQNGTGLGTQGTSIQPGSVTPSENNELLLTLLCVDPNHGTISVNSGFTITNTVVRQNNVNVGGSLAYKIQTTAGAENPTWSWVQNVNRVAVIATFKAAAGVASSLPPSRAHHQPRLLTRRRVV